MEEVARAKATAATATPTVSVAVEGCSIVAMIPVVAKVMTTAKAVAVVAKAVED